MSHDDDEEEALALAARRVLGGHRAAIERIVNESIDGPIRDELFDPRCLQLARHVSSCECSGAARSGSVSSLRARPEYRQSESRSFESEKRRAEERLVALREPETEKQDYRVESAIRELAYVLDVDVEDVVKAVEIVALLRRR